MAINNPLLVLVNNKEKLNRLAKKIKSIKIGIIPKVSGSIKKTIPEITNHRSKLNIRSSKELLCFMIYSSLT